MKKLKGYFVLFGAAMLLLTGCGFGGEISGQSYEKITPLQAKEMMEKGNVTVVDVRTASEYEEKHIPGALLLPVETIGTTPPQSLPDQKAVILIYCRSGNRSAVAAKKLADMGYTSVYDFGGIKDWPYETVGE